MVTANGLDPYAVGRIETLGMENDATAKETLERVCWQVQPIMRRRQFEVPLVKEFYPRQPGLMGMNVGGGGGGTREILLRLRRAGRPGSFLDYDYVLRTMLHELSHNVYGPHAAPFYKLLDELTTECEELLAEGIGGSGAGFDAASAGRVGGRNAGRELSTFDRREAALRAAEARARRQAIMPAGPRRLGGDAAPMGAMTPAEAAAAAAERRARDSKWCPTEAVGQQIEERGGTDAAIQAVLDAAYGTEGTEVGGKVAEKAKNAPKQEATAAAAAGRVNGSVKTRQKRIRDAVDDVEAKIEADGDVIDLTGDTPPPPLPPAAAPRRSGARGARSSRGSGEWACPMCTFLNPKPLALQCDICGTPRPLGSVAAAAAGGVGGG